MSKIRLHGSSSGYTDIAPASAAGSATVTLPTSAGEILLTDGSAASLTQIPAANIVGICTAGFERTGGFGGANPTENYAFANMSTTSFDNSGYALHGISSDAGSNGVTVDTSNNRLTPTVAGYYYVVYTVIWSHSYSNSGVTVYNAITKNGSNQEYTTLAIYHDAGTSRNTVYAVISLNGSSDYVDFRSYHNKSGQSMSCTNLSRGFMVKLRDN